MASHLRRDALLVRGPSAWVGPGSAEQRAGRCCASPGERCAASGTRIHLRTPTGS